MMNDNTPRRDARRVYRVPIALTVKCDFFVLADSLDEARRQAKLSDASDHFDFNPECIWIPDDDDTRRLRFDDVSVSVIDLSGVTLAAHYMPNEHPDFIVHPRR